MRFEALCLLKSKLSPVCTTKSLFGCLQSYFSPQKRTTTLWSVSWQHFTCSKCSLWRFLLPLTLYSCLLFFVGQLPKLLCLRSFTGELFPHPTQIWLFPHHFPHASPKRLLFHSLPPLHICQWFFSFCLQVVVETFSDTSWSKMLHRLHPPLQTSAANS